MIMNATNLFLMLPGLLFPFCSVAAQCANDENIHQFNYNGKTYEIIKENKTWAEAAACAASRNGNLAEINDAAEQEAIFTQLSDAGIDPDDTVANDGFGSYVWLGGNDVSIEGLWAWNGNNDDQAIFFWQGDAGGAPLNNSYNNWGNEPDNWGAEPGQDALAMAIVGFPNGSAGKWNDVNHNNQLFFVVEYNSILNASHAESEIDLILYPNPVTNMLFITNTDKATKATIVSVIGQEVITILKEELIAGKINIADIPAGLYIFELELEGNISICKKFIKL